MQGVKVLGEEEALLLKAREDCEDHKGKHKAGERWMVKGPMDYIPLIEVDVIETRRSIPLDKNEGIYVRNLDTGEVSAHIGSTYMLKSNEVLWEKVLPEKIEDEIKKQVRARGPRDKTRVVQYKIPQNCAI